MRPFGSRFQDLRFYYFGDCLKAGGKTTWVAAVRLDVRLQGWQFVVRGETDYRGGSFMAVGENLWLAVSALEAKLFRWQFGGYGCDYLGCNR